MKGEISLKELRVKKKAAFSTSSSLSAWGNERPNSYRHRFLKS